LKLLVRDGRGYFELLQARPGVGLVRLELGGRRWRRLGLRLRLLGELNLDDLVLLLGLLGGSL
jgi:hypothetical protein